MSRVLLGVGLAACWSVAGAQTLVPHDAKYQIHVAGGAGGQAIRGSGAATIKIERGCKAWRIRTTMSISVTAGGRTVLLKVQVAAVESLNGLTYESRSRTTAGNHREESSIRAKRASSGAGEAVVVSSTGRRTIQLPKGTRFPIGHMRQMLRDVAAGKTQLSALVFDQEGDGKLLQVVDQVMPSPVPPLSALAARLRAAKAYRVKTKTYARNDTSGNGRPALEEIVLANGVGLIMRANMGSMSLTGKLVSATPLTAPKCGS